MGLRESRKKEIWGKENRPEYLLKKYVSHVSIISGVHSYTKNR